MDLIATVNLNIMKCESTQISVFYRFIWIFKIQIKEIQYKFNHFPTIKLKARLYNNTNAILMEDSAGIYLIPIVIINTKKKMDYVNITTQKFKECLIEQTYCRYQT